MPRFSIPYYTAVTLDLVAGELLKKTDECTPGCAEKRQKNNLFLTDKLLFGFQSNFVSVFPSVSGLGPSWTNAQVSLYRQLDPIKPTFWIWGMQVLSIVLKLYFNPS